MAKNSITRRWSAATSALVILFSTFLLFASNDRYILVEGFNSLMIRPVFTFHSALPSSLTTQRMKATKLSAVAKRQKAIFDGAEFISIASFLISEDGSMSRSGEEGGVDVMPQMRAGYMTIVTGTTEEDGERVIGFERPSSSSEKEEKVDGEEFVSLGDGTFVYRDSMAVLPKKISDADAISTAAAALCGVH
eukprot:12991031-Ditylum_brightwellii.AAC.1